MENNQIIFRLENTDDKETALKNEASNLMTKLKNKFGSSYTVTADEFGLFDKDWTHNIKVRKGNKIGAEVTLKWEKNNPDALLAEVDESSKVGSIVTYGVCILFILIGGYMGGNHIEPLAFLPGYKMAAGLGALIGLIPGAIIAYVLKSILLKNEKEENKQLVNEVINTCKNE